MVDIQYVGELIWPKNIGYFLLLLSLFSTILAAYGYFQSATKNDNTWKKLANTAYTVQGVSMLAVIATIFYLMINKHYEYSYVQAHVSDDLPFQYIFSAFWEGQEGSFMLWIFWHNVLAWIIMAKNSKWVAPTLFFLSLIQVVILTMIQGFHFEVGEWFYKLGSNPLTLLRETMDIPLFANAEYVSLLQGTGLNPLLQNYWMTIHPPVLFLGFASVSIPFCYALGSLMIRDYKSWLQPALKWGLFSASILGIGILMGAAWAYEALSFGGYWAWDPVENTSLVPWITLVAGVHTNLIARSTKYSVKSTYWFYILSFLLIVYSTTLTRSGVLGDTSVHAFTEMGLESQLGAFIGIFTLLSLFYYFTRSREIPAPKEEESIGSREFWMFIGSLVLLFSAVMITASSSLPIFNKILQLFDPEFVSYVIDDPVEHYNKYQLWIGVIIGILSATAIFFRYNEHNSKRVLGKPLMHIGISAVIALAAHFAVNQWLQLEGYQFHLLLYSGLFTVIANLEYVITFIFGKGAKGKAGWSTIPSLMSHAGFGIMLIGVIASGVNMRFISQNNFAFADLDEDDQRGNNITLLKNRPMFMKGYWVEYQSDTVIGQNKYYDLNFKQIDANEKVTEEFTVRPNILYSNDLTKVASMNPDTKHYLFRDIFTVVAAIPLAQQDIKFAKEMEDTLQYNLVEFPYGETMQMDEYTIKVKDIQFDADHPDYSAEVGDIAMQMTLELTDTTGKSVITEPATVLRSTVVYKYHTHENDLHSRFRINEKTFEKMIKPDQLLNYESRTMESGSITEWNGYKIAFNGFKKVAENDGFVKEDDVSIKGKLEVTNPEGLTKTLEPTFIVRGKQVIPVRDIWWQESLYARLTNIDPTSGKADFDFAEDLTAEPIVALEIANNVPRQDLIAIEVREFPGINFVWLGCIMMMLGLGFGMALRMTKKWS